MDLAIRARFNPGLTPAWFGSLMELINHITMLSIILTGAALIREREHGTVEHLLVMPVTPTEIMLAKVGAMGLVVLLDTYNPARAAEVTAKVSGVELWRQKARPRMACHRSLPFSTRSVRLKARPTGL